MKQQPLMDIAGWEAFLHGVFAIAVTLLVLDIRVPDVASIASGSALIDSLVADLPRFGAYVLGFLYVGVYWINMHRVLRTMRGVDHGFLILGLAFLMVISAVPFVTALLAEYIGKDNGRDQVALVVFTSWQLVLALLANAALLYAAHGRRLLKPDVPEAGVRLALRIGLLGPLTWVLALLSALFLNGTVTLIFMSVVLAVFMFEPPTPGQPDAAGG
jgi:uncharacterized membrane protein